MFLGTSLDSWIKSYGIKDHKTFFPYEWLQNLECLEQTQFPEYKSFYSRLKNNYVCSPKEYQECKKLYATKEMKSMKVINIMLNKFHFIWHLFYYRNG